MRDKRFRIRQKERYRNKTKKFVRESFITRDEFSDRPGKILQKYDSYEECVEDFARHHEKNRKKCSCQMCRNQRRSKLSTSLKEKLTLQELRAMDEEEAELEEIEILGG